jgi:DNA (cytosine-5)-methyltransferase 1
MPGGDSLRYAGFPDSALCWPQEIASSTGFGWKKRPLRFSVELLTMPTALADSPAESIESFQIDFNDLLAPSGTTPQSASTPVLRALDFYSGVGGWSLGLKMAGVDVVQSYEWWDKANRTNALNNRHQTTEIDIRKLPLDLLPGEVDIVVGSPPCVEFSYSNRGGSGDIKDGLKDIEKFLEVVDFLKPRFWAMENVPRVASILAQELSPGGSLKRFAHLKPKIHILDVCEWGVPQQRKRCIAGDFDLDLLMAYRSRCPRRTLGDVVNALSATLPMDPIYAFSISETALHDHVREEFLSPEEERMNREMKSFHPVYNNMAFPDSLDRPGRTVTATCTRVSRESIVIQDAGKFRRLTVRERASLQSFPITYQFFGDSYSQKLKMVGNAVPPLFTYHIAHAMLGTHPKKIPSPKTAIGNFEATKLVPKETAPDSKGQSYPKTRRFRSALPTLRFKSGMRFEFANEFLATGVVWRVKFFFGNSKQIRELTLDDRLEDILKKEPAISADVENFDSALRSLISQTSADALQGVWNRSIGGGIHPYEIVDRIGETVTAILQSIERNKIPAKRIVSDILEPNTDRVGLPKVLRNSEGVLAGMLVGCACNRMLSSPEFERALPGETIS